MNVVELRHYTLRPRRRDDLIELFDREFIESQEREGATIAGQFRVKGAPESFVWLRGFAGMAERLAALSAFYGGAVWRRHRKAANATMIDSDDVLLLRPAWPGAGFDLSGCSRPRPGAAGASPASYLASVATFTEPVEREAAAYFHARVAPHVQVIGDAPVAAFVTERSYNDFPALPIREDANAFVWFERRSGERTPDAEAAIAGMVERFSATMLVRSLAPTARSLLR